MLISSQVIDTGLDHEAQDSLQVISLAIGSTQIQWSHLSTTVTRK